MHVIQDAESGILTTPDISGEKITEKLDITSADLATGIAFYEDKSVKEIVVVGALEFVPGKYRGEFFDHCYRILTDDGTMSVTVPYWSTWRGYYDFRFEWPPFCEQAFLVYNKEWRETNAKGLELECDFDFDYGYAWTPETLNRSDDSRSFWSAHYINSIDVVQLKMRKRPSAKD